MPDGNESAHSPQPVSAAAPKVGMPVPAQAAAPTDKGKKPTIISSSSPAVKPDGRKVKVGSSINLLTDTERIIKVQKIQSQILRISSVLVLVCLLIGGASYGGWWYQNSRLNRLERQMETAENELDRLSEVYQYAAAYDDRLSQIGSLWSGVSDLTPRLIKDLVAVGESTSGVFRSMDYKERAYEASYQFSELRYAHELLEILNKKETEDEVWKPIGIGGLDFSSGQYSLNFSTDLTKKYEESN